ncbi:hypothetical protein DFR58_1174 [Anaerobacterium chartisolvens]|uniref:Cyclic nucleotide-binding domain-containing protein n=1 Tax=Anaerobacterium chartisolvens TaxID=1297424 RepID=A0A369AVP8_9FIRM|nr:hypothetical protein [Anaerobacterium chartisolvens]RCX13470.1 hypothetical protein DFR58_1174 [Anaerobacterium chartisolvens]
MGIVPCQSGNYSVKENDIIFNEGQDTQSVNLLLQGKLDAIISHSENACDAPKEQILRNGYRLFSIDQNVFINAADLFNSKKYSFSYIARESSTIYSFAAKSPESVIALIESQKDYAAYMVTSISTLLDLSYSALRDIRQIIKELSNLTDNLIVYFWLLKEKYSFASTPSENFFRDGLDKLQTLKDKNVDLPFKFDKAFLVRDFSEVFETEYLDPSAISTPRVDYYRHILELPLELRKSFFAADAFITEYHLKDASELFYDIYNALKESFCTANEYLERLYCDNKQCIFSEYQKASMDQDLSSHDTVEILKALDFTVLKIKEFAAIYKKQYNHKLDIDITYLELAVNQTKSHASASSIEVRGSGETISEELKDSLEKIVTYSDVPKEIGQAFLANFSTFRHLKNKLSSDNSVRELKSAIAASYFNIYGAVFKKVVSEKNTSRLFSMFLNYSYMDENVLTPEEVNTLYYLSGKQPAPASYSAYGTKDWLINIYSKEKDPSINEFGQDYNDIFREKKKRKELSDKDKFKYDNDLDGRVDFEVKNMLRVAQKLCHGQISVYFPVLHSEMITRDLSKTQVTDSKIQEAIDKIVETDFSIFHREVSYRNADTGIEKEFIMKRVVPDIIRMPIYGCRSLMWQEITGRDRTTPGRLILPAFTGENLNDMLLKLLGNFRWELCRTMMGVSWNDITQKSLTSEYMDYIQFYKKNKDLSEEAKEKVKAQIQKYHNRARDIFTSDYEIWINHESKGIMRLNKVSREILFRHCPFSKAIREMLSKQPRFVDMAAKYENSKAKYVRELENRYNKIVKSGIALDPELEENLNFYKYK